MKAESLPSTSREPVFGQVRPAKPTDLRAVAQVHVDSFPGFFLAALGPGVMRAYYELVLRYDQGILLLAESEGGVAGFVSGVVDAKRFYRVLAANKWRFALLVLMRLASRPGLVSRLLVNRRRLVRPEPPAHSLSEKTCELSAVAVRPEFAGKGLGKKLIRAFLEMARCKKATDVYLTTDARDNDAVNAIYQRLKFRLARTFDAPGRRPMNEYVLSIPADGESDPQVDTA